MFPLLKLFMALAPAVKDLVVLIVKEIKGAKDPKRSAERALEEITRIKRIDELLKARGPL